MTPPFVEYVLHGWKLCPIESGSKGPRSTGWQLEANAISTVERAQALQSAGLLHAWSGTCAIDVDDQARARDELDRNGISLDALITADDAVRIERGDANRTKLIYSVDTPLTTVKLACGLELRCASRNGQSVQDVLPPSLHPSGSRYEWVYGNDLIADWRYPPPLPAELRAYWESHLSAHIPAEHNTEVTDSDELCKLLDGLDPDMPYDEWVKVGMALHHACQGADAGLQLWDRWSSGGVKYGGYSDLLSHWRSFRTGGEAPATVNTLRTLQTADPVDFDVIKPDEFNNAVDPPTEPVSNPFAFTHIGDWVQRPPPEWLIDRVVPESGLAMVYGPSGSGKTFWALDMALHIAAGRSWLGKRTRGGPVAWIAAEAAGSIRNRSLAFAAAYGTSLADTAFHVTGEAPNLSRVDTVKQLIEAAAPLKPVLVVVDTLAAASGGANENSGEDMNAVMAACRALHRATGAVIMLIHHTGKDASRGARGWSGIKAAVDTEIEITDGEGETRKAWVTKQRDADTTEWWSFELCEIEELESCAVAPRIGAVKRRLAATRRSKKRELKGEW